MSERSFERRVELWLELGPTQIPADTVQAVLTGVEAVAQERPPFRIVGRSVPPPRARMLATAAVIVLAVSASSAMLLRKEAPGPGDLLFDFPVTKVVERSGGPATVDEVIQVGDLRQGGTYVIAAECTGGGAIVVNVHDRSMTSGPSGEDLPNPEPVGRVDVPCDGERKHLNQTTQMAPNDFDVSVAITAGATWRVEIGEYREFSTQPSFPAIEPTEGWNLLMDGGTMITMSRPGPGIGLQVPSGATKVAVLVQCSGAEITLTAEGATGVDAEPKQVPCDDPSRTTRIEYPADGLYFGVSAGADSPAWFRLVGQADGAISAPRPPAPPMPAELASVPYADADGEYLAFGTLGSPEQTVIQLSGARAGVAGGDFVGVTTPDANGGTKLELWSISEATMLQPLASTTGSDTIYASWVDETHDLVFYGVSRAEGFSAEWHRVAFDGSGDKVIGSAPIGLVMTGELMAADGSAFIVHWCTAIGPCTRLIHDTATGGTREVQPADARWCSVQGAAGGVVVLQSGACDGPGRLIAENLDGGDRHVIVEGWANGTVILGSDGPVLVYSEGTETQSTYRAVSLNGGEPREIAVFEHADFVAPQLSRVRLPVGDWVLLAGPLADTPSNNSIGRTTPVLLNIVTGEQIELVNLPPSVP